MKYQTLRPHFFSMGRWCGWWVGCVLVRSEVSGGVCCGWEGVGGMMVFVD